MKNATQAFQARINRTLQGPTFETKEEVGKYIAEWVKENMGHRSKGRLEMEIMAEIEEVANSQMAMEPALYFKGSYRGHEVSIFPSGGPFQSSAPWDCWVDRKTFVGEYDNEYLAEMEARRFIDDKVDLDRNSEAAE